MTRRRTEPLRAAPDPFPDTPEFNDMFRAMFTEIHGFVYAGSNLEATIAAVKWLRSHPDNAGILLR